MLIVASVLWIKSNKVELCEKEFPEGSYIGQHDSSLEIRYCGFSQHNCITQWLLG